MCVSTRGALREERSVFVSVSAVQGLREADAPYLSLVNSFSAACSSVAIVFGLLFHFAYGYQSASSASMAISVNQRGC
ncbi:hypothetical protein HNP40_003914 [Mycobacteroides chelonae]|nr:hypothetical protein [Mycobacteroides chelonae]